MILHKRNSGVLRERIYGRVVEAVLGVLIIEQPELDESVRERAAMIAAEGAIRALSGSDARLVLKHGRHN